MAARLLNRRALRAPAEPLTPTPEAAAATMVAPKAAVKPKVRKKVVKAPPRMFARWAVCDNGMKHVAVFEYRDRSAADAKLSEMLERKAGAYFMVLVKGPRADVDLPVA
jgi:hypothetical protein